MNWDTVQQFIRIVLQLAAGFMVQRGLLTEEMAVTATGAILSLAGVLWWAFWNKKRVE
jgi:hypothetical protein